ncbi:hypothetical protein [Blastococcus sp. CCUG 61487]|uniref:hypothetical protein n=1 Tax=Blastococcus sp. CCUG 61487 TaxID=1840703 RepID=UPI0010BFE20E|nr:hypothetical protein [Blastococcus sp. CCUG 61487]
MQSEQPQPVPPNAFIAALMNNGLDRLDGPSGRLRRERRDGAFTRHPLQRNVLDQQRRVSREDLRLTIIA